MAAVNAELVGDAVRIIRSVTDTADIVCVNKNQCQRLAQRFDAIRTALEALPTNHFNHGSDTITSDTPSAMDQILQQILEVLKKGDALVQDYADEREALRNVLYRADNCEAFKEIHEEIDALATFLDFEDQSSNDQLLRSDAEMDRGEMLPELHKLNILEDTTGPKRAEDVDVESNMNAAITDKCYNTESTAEDLSYLNIPFSAIRLAGAIKKLTPLHERKSQGDAHLDGMALVQSGTWNGCDCAVKVFMSEKIHWNEAERHKEIASLVKLRHPHITQLIGCAQNQEKTYVLYEKMDSDLRVLMESRGKKKVLPKVLRMDDRPFTRAEEVSIITQIARGMFYLHEKNLVHGELKCSNLLVKKVASGHIDVKVADFHCSRQLGTATTELYSPAHRFRWMPPEAFDHYNVEQPADEVLQKGDVYSFAMTCYEVVTGKYPFDGVKGKKEFFAEKIKRGDRPKLPEDLSSDLKRLITKCWHRDPEQRPSFQDICYVLKVDAVNLVSQFQKLLANFCLDAICNDSDSPEEEEAPEGKNSWNELLGVNKSDEGIDHAMAKDLPHYLKIRPFDLKPGHRLGTGASAMVYEANWIGCKFAVKWLKVDHVEKLRSEVGILMQMLHPHVIRLVGFAVLANRCAIVMELMESSLQGFMNSRIQKDPKHVPFSELESLGIITKLALGMDFLHSRNVAHGDLKCANVLVRNTTSIKTSRMDVKIVDFGLSQLLLGKISPSAKKPSVVGRWRAPEVIESMESKGEHVEIDSKAADVYSFGMMCSEVLTGKMPFHKLSDTTAMAVAKGGGVPNLDSVNVHQDVKKLLMDCWSLKPQARPKFGKIVERLASLSKSKQ